MVGSLANSKSSFENLTPVFVPLGDCGLLLRFATELDGEANRLAVATARILNDANLQGVREVCPSLVSIFIRYDPSKTSFMNLCDCVRVAIASQETEQADATASHRVEITYGGTGGPDLEFVAHELGVGIEEFICRHNGAHLRVLAVGFAPGFAYCGLHKKDMNIPRRKELHAMVPAGSIIFAAGQTAITASDGPTGWHVIGRTDFRNFNAKKSPPTLLNAGDAVVFEGALST